MRLQDNYDCRYCVVDLHAMTMPYDIAELRANTENMLIGLLACGIDPARANLCLQSLVPEHTELQWVFSCVCAYGDLMRQTQFDEGTEIRVRLAKQPRHGLVHVAAPGQDSCEGRPGQKPPRRARMPLADGLVVGIEQISEIGIEDLVAGEMRHEQEGLEEPGDVPQVPLRGAGVGHGLDLLVLGAQGRCQPLARRPHRRIASGQIIACRRLEGRGVVGRG